MMTPEEIKIAIDDFTESGFECSINDDNKLKNRIDAVWRFRREMLD